MAENTLIEWTDATWNPVTGCTKVSPGCDFCYAERLTVRFGRGPFTQIKLHPTRLNEPLKWRKARMVFTCSMSDLFHPLVPPDFLLSVFEVMRATPWHSYQVLTKRPGRMAHFANAILAPMGIPWPANVWAGTSVESQKYAPRLEVLARVPAAVRFVSVEPLLSKVDLGSWLQETLSWVIIGGESGPQARKMGISWARSLKDQCRDAGVPTFVKQLGSHWAKRSGAKDSKGGDASEWPPELNVRQFPLIPKYPGRPDTEISHRRFPILAKVLA